MQRQEQSIPASKPNDHPRGWKDSRKEKVLDKSNLSISLRSEMSEIEEIVLSGLTYVLKSQITYRFKFWALEEQGTEDTLGCKMFAQGKKQLKTRVIVKILTQPC